MQGIPAPGSKANSEQEADVEPQASPELPRCQRDAAPAPGAAHRAWLGCAGLDKHKPQPSTQVPAPECPHGTPRAAGHPLLPPPSQPPQPCCPTLPTESKTSSFPPSICTRLSTRKAFCFLPPAPSPLISSQIRIRFPPGRTKLHHPSPHCSVPACETEGAQRGLVGRWEREKSIAPPRGCR